MTMNGPEKSERVIIFGAGQAGSQLAQIISKEDKYKLICFVDNDYR